MKRSQILSLPEAHRLPAFDANRLRDLPPSAIARVWVGDDGVACLLLVGDEPDTSEDDGTPGQWVTVEMDDPETIETPSELAARAWAEKLNV